jgi:hypothetical protein
MPLQARRVFRLSLATALALAGAYALKVPLPFLAPLFALMLAAKPAPPLGPKGLLALVLLVLLTMGVGLLLSPVLLHYPLSGVLMAALGLYFSFFLSIHRGKALVAAFLTAGITMISAAGLVSFALSTTVVQALVLGITLAVFCHWLVYPWFPEDPPTGTKPAAEPLPDNEQSTWIALRATLIVLPAYLLALTNPAMYLPIIMKSVSLGQQSSLVDAHSAGRELLGSTFLAGCFAVLFWVLLGVATNLWMFFWLMLLIGLYFSSKLYRLIPTRFPASFWLNTGTTMLILLGPAVEDSANGKDVYAAFAVRMGLFVAVTLYAWLAVYLLEHVRSRRRGRLARAPSQMELT